MPGPTVSSASVLGPDSGCCFWFCFQLPPGSQPGEARGWRKWSSQGAGRLSHVLYLLVGSPFLSTVTVQYRKCRLTKSAVNQPSRGPSTREITACNTHRDGKEGNDFHCRATSRAQALVHNSQCGPPAAGPLICGGARLSLAQAMDLDHYG